MEYYLNPNTRTVAPFPAVWRCFISVYTSHLASLGFSILINKKKILMHYNNRPYAYARYIYSSWISYNNFQCHSARDAIRCESYVIKTNREIK